MKKKILVLGGAYQQMQLIKHIKANDGIVYLSDYYDNPPCLCLVDHASRISTFDVQSNLEYAGRNKIEAVLTSGTDQPVYTAAYVSEKLGLYYPVNSEQARNLTDKYYMKKVMIENNIPCPEWIETEDPVIIKRNLPVVIKPADNQGQRGLSVIRESSRFQENLKHCLNKARKFSRTGKVIIEKFCSGDEITVNCWVKGGTPNILLITDRPHFNDDIVLGVSTQQRFPSEVISSKEDRKKLEDLLIKITRAFEVKDGPLYIQILKSDEDLKVVEIAYRIGGAFENYLIPLATGHDITGLYYDLVINQRNQFDPVNFNDENPFGSVCMIFLNPGIVEKIEIPEKFSDFGMLFIEEKDRITPFKDATSRSGFFIITGTSRDEYKRKLHEMDNSIKILSDHNKDLMIHDIYL